MYKECRAIRKKNGWNEFDIHLWTDEGYEVIRDWKNLVYKECPISEMEFEGLNGEGLKRTTTNWKNDTPGLHFHDMPPYQKFLVEKYGTNDETSTTHKKVFFDIETEMLDSLTEEGIKEAPKKITSIAWYDEQVKQYGCIILDPKGTIKNKGNKDREVISCPDERFLLMCFLEKMQEIEPDILIGWNSDFFDIPYLYYRMCNVLSYSLAQSWSPLINANTGKRGCIRETPWAREMYIDIFGIQSLDYMRMHKKYSWADEPSMKLQDIGEKYVGLGKVEYEGKFRYII